MANKVVEVTVKWNGSDIEGIKRKFILGMEVMGKAMVNRARDNAPKKTGALYNSIESNTIGDQVIVHAGGQSGTHVVNYARMREFNNNLHPSTKYYMTRAFNTIVKGDINQYFKGIA